MLDLLIQYGLFLAKTVTFVVAFLVVLSAIFSLSQRRRGGQADGVIEVTPLNERLKEYAEAMREVVFQKDDLKQWQKAEKKKEKQEEKDKKSRKGDEGEGNDKGSSAARSRVYVLKFDGDIRASAVESLRREITAVMTLANPEHDEIVINLESPGGVVHGYGLAASQLARIRQKKIRLTICVDKVAASGGYMMACLGDRIYAAPFAILGSIGVVAQVPNFNRFLKKHDVDVELHTAGEFKRTLTVLGENTDEGRRKFREELDDTHLLFKEFVSQNRPQVDIDTVATGEHWYGQRALDLKLVDELMTSDEYITQRIGEADVFSVRYMQKHALMSRLGLAAEGSADRLMMRWWERLQNRWFY